MLTAYRMEMKVTLSDPNRPKNEHPSGVFCLLKNLLCTCVRATSSGSREAKKI